MSSNQNYQSFSAEYCEWCGTLVEATDELEEKLTEPVHRIDVLEALGGVEDVVESTAIEKDTCDCDGQIVQRCYAVGDIPECEYEPDEDQIKGRDPDEDSLINLGDGWEETREVPWLEEGGSA